jgi:cyclophilin family peptidyl-prolyl cis-trans isomerase
MNVTSARTLLFFLFSWLGLVSARADFIAADFRTTEGDFTAFLDYVNAPLAVANFIQLAGKDEDILETALGVPALGALGHDRQFYQATAESDVIRLPLTVALIPETDDFRAYYAIYQNQTLIGGVETQAPSGYHPDITGEDRIRLERLQTNPNKYRITLRYPRPWLDARDQQVKEAPMYRAIKVHRIVQGKRFFAGTMTDDPLEHPGYHFQDELARNPGNLANPFGTPFNAAGVLAMDTLAPNRNGSGFFITTDPDPSLNGRYTAFGQVSSGLGLAVVRSITNASLGSDGSPNEDIYILDITIRRSGLTANAFMEGFQQKYLPGGITPLPLSVENVNGEWSLVSAPRPGSFEATYISPDLGEFTGGILQAQGPGTTQGLRSDLSTLISLSPRYFFKGFSTTLPRWPSALIELQNARLFFSVTSGVDQGTMNLYFGQVLGVPDGEEDDGLVRVGGTYNLDMLIERTEAGMDPEFVRSFGQGTFFATYDSSESPYRGRLQFSNVTGPLNVGQITLHFDSGAYFNNPQANPALFIRRFDASTTDPEVPFLNYRGVFQKSQ